MIKLRMNWEGSLRPFSLQRRYGGPIIRSSGNGLRFLTSASKLVTLAGRSHYKAHVVPGLERNMERFESNKAGSTCEDEEIAGHHLVGCFQEGMKKRERSYFE